MCTYEKKRIYYINLWYLLNEEGDTESRYKCNSGTPYVEILIGIYIKLTIQVFEDNSIAKKHEIPRNRYEKVVVDKFKD